MSRPKKIKTALTVPGPSSGMSDDALLSFNPILSTKYVDKSDPFTRDLMKQLVAAAVKTGTAPEKIYATIKTGRMLTTANMQFLSKADIKEWQDAAREYLRLAQQGRDQFARGRYRIHLGGMFDVVKSRGMSTHVVGFAMSDAAVLLQAGKWRTMTNSSLLMFHGAEEGATPAALRLVDQLVEIVPLWVQNDDKSIFCFPCIGIFAKTLKTASVGLPSWVTGRFNLMAVFANSNIPRRNGVGKTCNPNPMC